ncbi:laminin-like protein epi-1 isoform X2 [Mercenaria mercenaria]|uniref:laminin-like protein epi-1 isoform X2 n=1 Tax=Mercenaria mercenaria TaxID=6596 RepID=UPI00234FA2A0|nr:laminin-like protein epi-1 isoform X2 [Mercenaria mercenaria]XP_053383161.1 laminin-like protein epi-1 isoform X2 [Mercenaria mercenaria]
MAVIENIQFLNFAAVQPAKRPGTSLACCPIPEPEGPYTTAEITTAKQIEFPAETTTTMALPPPGRCALDVVDPVDVTEDDQRGYYFGAYPNSRLEYDRLPVSLRIIATLSMEFRTTQPDGVMFYFSDVMHRDHIGVTMKGGMIRFTFDSGTGTGELMTTKTYNDGHWHKLMIGRNMREGTMMVDDDELTPVESAGRARTINGRPPYSFGGLRESPVAGAVKNLNGVTNSFAGCIANIKVNNKDTGPAPVQNGTLPCSDFTYNGAYFYNDGGYIKLMDSFNVKKKMTMSVEIRPRSLNGVIFSVHGKGDFVILQLVEGELWFTADNGAGSFTAKYIPEMNNKLCDGAWHTIKAEKIRNVVILAVDDKESITEISAGRATSAHTNSPIYLGGKPDDITKGVRAKGDYKGCMRNLSINGKYQYLNTGIAFKDVSLDSCPVN